MLLQRGVEGESVPVILEEVLELLLLEEEGACITVASSIMVEVLSVLWTADFDDGSWCPASFDRARARGFSNGQKKHHQRGGRPRSAFSPKPSTIIFEARVDQKTDRAGSIFGPSVSSFLSS